MDDAGLKGLSRRSRLAEGERRVRAEGCPGRRDYRAYSKARAIIQLQGVVLVLRVGSCESPETRKTMHQDVLTLMDGGLRRSACSGTCARWARWRDSIRAMSALLDGSRRADHANAASWWHPRIDEVLGKETGRLRSLLAPQHGALQPERTPRTEPSHAGIQASRCRRRIQVSRKARTRTARSSRSQRRSAWSFTVAGRHR